MTAAGRGRGPGAVIALAVATLAVAGTGAGVGGCARADVPGKTTLERVRAAGVLRWGADQQGGEPYVFEDPERPGTLVGFEVEIAQSLARHLGVRAQLVQNDWPMLIPSLERGTFDIALNGIEVTPALAERVAFSRPYFAFTERLVARADDTRVSDLESLRGVRVGTLAATQAWHTLERAGAKAVAYEGVEEPFIDLENGRVDAVLLDDIIVDRYAPQHPTLRIAGDVGEGRYAVALRPEDADLRAEIDGGIDALVTSGELHKILDR
ncbi:MAG: ABC transporter substrate-binding protein, partial [Bacteroidota bacterium]